jgi:hypothetical protein
MRGFIAIVNSSFNYLQLHSYFLFLSVGDDKTVLNLFRVIMEIHLSSRVLSLYEAVDAVAVTPHARSTLPGPVSEALNRPVEHCLPQTISVEYIAVVDSGMFSQHAYSVTPVSFDLFKHSKMSPHPRPCLAPHSTPCSYFF